MSGAFDPDADSFTDDLEQPDFFLEEPDLAPGGGSPEAELLNDVTQHYLNEIGAKPLFSPDRKSVV